MDRQREKLRRDDMREISKLLKSADFRGTFSVKDALGTRPIIVALPDDRMGWAFERVRKMGGSANITFFVGDDLAVIGVEPGPADLPVADEDDCPVTAETQIGMLLEYLRVRRRGVHCRLVEPEYTLELLEEPPPAVPA